MILQSSEMMMLVIVVVMLIWDDCDSDYESDCDGSDDYCDCGEECDGER